MPHSCGQVPAKRQLSTEQLDILEHETTKYTPNDLLLLFIKDLLVMGNQYYWWASKILDPGCPGTTAPLLDFRNPGFTKQKQALPTSKFTCIVRQ
jgi:hypothetical protein